MLFWVVLVELEWARASRASITQHSLQFSSIYTPLVMLFHAKFKIGRSTHTGWAIKNINKLHRYKLLENVGLTISSSMT